MTAPRYRGSVLRADAHAARSAPGTRDAWRCSRCGKLLGVLMGQRLQIQFARGHDYLVSLPATATCRDCHALNEVETAEPEIDPRRP